MRLYKVVSKFALNLSIMIKVNESSKGSINTGIATPRRMKVASILRETFEVSENCNLKSQIPSVAKKLRFQFLTEILRHAFNIACIRL